MVQNFDKVPLIENSVWYTLSAGISQYPTGFDRPRSVASLRRNLIRIVRDGAKPELVTARPPFWLWKNSYY